MTLLTFACIIPCYNREEFIAEAIESALKQSPAPAEIVVADDGSTDRSVQVAEAFGNPVRVLRLERGGAARARNAAAGEARSDILAFLDSDDLWLPGHLERLGRILNEEPSVAMAYEGGVDRIEDNAYDPSIVTMNKHAKHDGWIYPQLCEKNFINMGGVGVRREIFLRMRGFDPELVIGEDWDLWCRIALASPIRFTGEAGIVYRQHASNLSQNAVRRASDMIAFRKKRLLEMNAMRGMASGGAYSESALAECRKFCEEDLVARLKKSSAAAKREGDRRTARRYLKQALALRPASPRLIERYLKTFLP